MAKYIQFDALKKILVTGAAGFVGFHLSKLLLERGASVAGFDNVNGYYDTRLKYDRLDILDKYGSFSFIKGDLADQGAVDGLFEAAKPDIVVHLAAQAGVRYSLENPRAYVDSNITGFLNILEACRHSATVGHLLYASSSSVYGNQEKTPFAVEDSVDCPISLYAATKKSDELMAYTYSHLFGIPVTGLRFFTVYGPFGRPDMAYFEFTRRIFGGEPIKVFNNGDMYRDFTYVDDITRGIENMLCSPPGIGGGSLPGAGGGVGSDAGAAGGAARGARYALYNIGNNRPVKLMYFIEALEKIIGKTAIKEFLPMQPGDVYQTYADIGALERDFGFRPATGIEEGLAKFVDWYRGYYGVA